MSDVDDLVDHALRQDAHSNEASMWTIRIFFLFVRDINRHRFAFAILNPTLKESTTTGERRVSLHSVPTVGCLH